MDVNINSQLVRIHGNDYLPRCYLALTLLSEEIQNVIKTLVTGSAQQQLPIKNLMQLHVIIPTQEVLRKFEIKVEPIIEHILINDKECTKLKMMLNALIKNI